MPQFFPDCESARRALSEFSRGLERVGGAGSVRFFLLLDERYLCAPGEAGYPQYLIVMDSAPGEQSVDDLCFQLQDRWGWPIGHYLVNSPSKRNIIAAGELADGPRVRDLYLDTDDVRRVLRGEGVALVDRMDAGLRERMRSALTRLEGRIDRRKRELDIDGLDGICRSPGDAGIPAGCPGIKTVIRHEFHRMRGRAPTRETRMLRRLKKILRGYTSGERPRHFMLYGRFNGCGKSQYLYHLMGYLHHLGYPFVYKEAFHSHYRRYLADPGPADTGGGDLYSLVDPVDPDKESATAWLLSTSGHILRKTGRRPVLLVDEDDVDWSQLLSDHFVIAADKDSRGYPREDGWALCDLVRWDPVDAGYVARALADELSFWGLDDDGVPGLRAVLPDVARRARVPGCHSCGGRSVLWGKRIISLCLAAAVRRRVEGDDLWVSRSDSARWGRYFWAAFVPRSGPREQEFHCEYIVFDGRSCAHDPYVSFRPVRLVQANARMAAERQG